MNNRVLCIVVLAITILIFWGNYSTARSGCVLQDESCTECKCKVDITVKNPDPKKEPSCSVVFNVKALDSATKDGDPLVPLVGRTSLFVSAGEVKYSLNPFSACGFTVYCDPGAAADIRCEGLEKVDKWIVLNELKAKEYRLNTWNEKSGRKCGTTCLDRGDDGKQIYYTCNNWARPAAKKKPPVSKPPVKKLPGKKPGLASILLKSFGTSLFPLSSFAPLKRSEPESNERDEYAFDRQDAVSESRGILNDSIRWKPLDADAGLEDGVMIVTAGEVEAQSFCTGDTVLLAAGQQMSMPTCPGDVSGRWEGAFARPRPKAAPPETPRSVVPMILDLRKVNGSLTGELKTSDGTFSVSGSQNGTDVGIEATRSDKKGKINLQGSLTRGTIVFGGSEESPEGIGTYRLVGYFKRMFIADGALRAAVLNEPYKFRLSAFSPGGPEVKFRLLASVRTSPATTNTAGGQKEINWFTNAENLRGRNGERFTFLCPANGSLNGYLYGTDTYSDSSSICKAAVHAGHIKLQTGGVVTIEIRQNAVAYPATTRNGVLSSTYSYGTGKGSFVFATGDAPKVSVETPKVAERGLLPRGISFDTRTGTFSGTPTETGRFDVTVIAEDGAGNTFEQPLTLHVKKMTVTNALLPDAFVGQPYVAALRVTGGQPPYRFSSGMPRGLQLDPSTGEIRGTPSASILFGGYDVTIRDSQNNVETQRVTLSVRGTTILGSHYLPDAGVGAPYRTQFQGVGNTSPIIWKAYPTNISLIGLVLNEQTGEISGTPTKAGSFLIQMNAEAGGSVSRSFTLTVE